MRPSWDAAIRISLVGVIIAGLSLFFDVLGFVADPQKRCFYKIPWESNYKDCNPQQPPVKKPSLPLIL